MSRLGKLPVVIPSGVTVTEADGVITVTGPKGTLTQASHSAVAISIGEGEIALTPDNTHPDAPALWGTYAALIRNMILGVTEGFEKKLEIEGVGYRADAQGDTLTLNVGYSHPVVMKTPDGVSVAVEKNLITVAGVSKEVVGQFAANIRKVRPPEPYKGKGIHYLGEYIIRKQGKKAV